MRLLFILISFSSFSQTLLKYDNIESWTWAGAWWNITPASYYTNASTSGTTSAAILGAGNGTSATEQNWYSLPNVTGLNPLYQYEFRFRLGSYTFSNATATTRGVDVADLIEVQVSRDNELTYTSELRITGFNNSTWAYQSATINHTADGVYNSSTDVYASVSGNNNGLSTGYSTIKLKISGITQIAVDILARVNSAGEEWWVDNIELWQITNPLPIEFVSFKGNLDSLWWESASEFNNDYYTISHSLDGYTFEDVEYVNGFVYSIEPKRYAIQNTEGKGYFKLSQTDKDGTKTELDIIFIQEQKQRILLKVVNMLGQQVETLTEGQVYLLIYSDGTIQKIIK